jgi:hypothetical protein
MAASFPHHACRRQQSRARHRDRDTEGAANPSRCSRIRQVALSANQPSSSEQQWTPRDVQRHCRALHPRRANRRSEPSICSESLFHDNNLPTVSPEVGFTTLGQSAGFVDPTAGSREPAERVGQKKWSRKPNPLEDPTGHRSGLQACPARRISASNRAGQSDPLCPPVHRQQLRTDHFDSGSGLRHHQPTGADAAYACSGHRGHCSPISEILALQWRDIDVENQCIYVRRAYVYGKFGKPKSKASKRPVPLHPVLAAHLLNCAGKRRTARKRNLCSPLSN